MSHGSSLSPRLLARALLVVAALLSLSVCSQQRQVPDDYGATTEDNFLEGCIVAMTAEVGRGEAVSSNDADRVCQCSYDGISDPRTGIPFEEFKEINAKQEEDPSELPEPIRKIVDDCKAEELDQS